LVFYDGDGVSPVFAASIRLRMRSLETVRRGGATGMRFSPWTGLSILRLGFSELCAKTGVEQKNAPSGASRLKSVGYGFVFMAAFSHPAAFRVIGPAPVPK
jgi:hypothetical protein